MFRSKQGLIFTVSVIGLSGFWAVCALTPVDVWLFTRGASQLTEQPSTRALADLAFSDPASLKGLKEHTFSGHSTYETISTKAGDHVLRGSSRGTSSALFAPVHIPLRARPVLTWEWKAVTFPSNKKNSTFAANRDNDYVGRVYAIFERRAPFLHDTIQYVWDDHFPPGTSAASPYSKRVKMLVVEHGVPAGESSWVLERRDLAADYKQLHGRDAEGKLVGIGFMTDSDNTGTASEIYFRSLSVQVPAE